MKANVTKEKQAQDQDWDLVIKPHRAWWDLRLGQLWRYRDLIKLFVWRDFVSTYKQTILGPLWYLIQPLMTTLVFTVIFGNIANLPTDGLPHFLFYMSGTVMWTYFANCLKKTSNTFAGNAGLFGKVYFPRLAIPVADLISNLITFAIQFALFLAFLTYFMLSGSDVHITTWVLLLPVLIFLMAGLGLGFGIIISSLTTKYRDLRYLVSFGMQLWMYATPVIYPASTIPGKWQWVLTINPITPIIEAFRYAFLGAGSASWGGLGYSFAFMLVVFTIGVLIFNRVEATFMDTV
ncbi:MAG: ABC transporter permease [Anaerolineaceae bacterium]|nr:ABC transporter permease [Anaerolineaceae bacterium]